MSIFGSLSTAVLGLTAQSRALSHISDNIANAQTTGYKRVDSSFQTLVLESNARIHAAGGVIAQPKFQNSIQGGLQQVQSPTNIAIQGDGFFTVSRAITGETAEEAAEAPIIGRSDIFYTRVGDFELDKDRFLTNSAGYRLNGFVEDPVTGIVNTFGSIQPIQITNTLDKPVPTSEINLTANLPATPDVDETAPTTTLNIFDNLGRPQTLTLNWRREELDQWRLIIQAPDSEISPFGDGLVGEDPTPEDEDISVIAEQSIESRRQMDVITFGTAVTSPTGTLVQVGERYSVTVNSREFELEITADNVGQIEDFDGVATALATQIQIASNTDVIAKADGNRLILISDDAGVPFTSEVELRESNPTTNSATFSASDTVITFTGTNTDIGDVYTVDIGGNSFSVTITADNYASLATTSEVVEDLERQIIRANPSPLSTGVTLDRSGSSLTLTGGDTWTTAASGVTNYSGNALTPDQDTIIENGEETLQKQTIRYQNIVGDEGAILRVEIAPPTEVNPTITGSQAAAPSVAQVTTATFAAAGTTATVVDTEYKFEIENTTYSLLITSDNIGDYATINDVMTELANRVNSANPGLISANATALPGSIVFSGLLDDFDFEVTTAEASTIPAATIFEYETTGEELSMDQILQNLRDEINQAGLPLRATVQDGLITLTSSDGEQSFVATPSALAGETPSHFLLEFGPNAAFPDIPAGTLRDVSIVGNANTALPPISNLEGDEANVTFTVNFGAGEQNITLALGEFHRGNGVTQFAGEAVNVNSVQQDGSPRGQFKNVEMNENGDVIVNFDNGRSRTVAKVPLTFFNNPNALQRETGGVFSQTAASGQPNGPFLPGTNGVGLIVANALENSNVDIADEFTKLIVTQRTYSANSRIVTTADEMLQEVLNIKR